MSYVNRKLKDIKASIMYFDYGVYNAFFANCWKTCKKISSMMSAYRYLKENILTNTKDNCKHTLFRISSRFTMR